MEKSHGAEFDGFHRARAQTISAGNVCSRISSETEDKVPLGPKPGSKRSPRPLGTTSGY